MGRKKKDLEMVTEEVDTTESDDAAVEMFLSESEGESDETSEEEADAEAEEKPKRKPRRRAPRRKPVAETVEPTAEPLVAAAAVASEPEIETPPATFAFPPAPAPGMVAASNTANASEKDAVERHWDAARLASESIVASLDKVNSLMRELPDHYAVSLQKSLKQSARPAANSRLVFAMSVTATVLSLLSLGLSQSARQTALNSHSAPFVQVQPSAEAPSVAVDTRRAKRRAPRSR